MKSVRFPLWLLLATLTCSAADPSTVRAVLLSTPSRKPAPPFALVDAAGKTAKLKDYRGKVVLVDFWATWCHGCKEEIPWFSQFQRTYGGKGFEVVGVSLDEDGWKAVKPFLADTDIPYRMLLGDDVTAQAYMESRACPMRSSSIVRVGSRRRIRASSIRTTWKQTSKP